MIFDPQYLDRLDQEWVRAMMACPQDSIHHGEGDVWTHTKLVCQKLVAQPAFLRQPDEIKDALFAAAVLHDVAKPATYAIEDGRITAKNHAPKGAIMARRILWEMGVPFEQREMICGLIRYHMRPFHLLDVSNAESYVAQISLTVRCDLLAIFVAADNHGRIAPTIAQNDEQILIFEDFCRELNCWDRPYPFYSDHARYVHFNLGREITNASFDDTRCPVTVMVGMPGSGKDRWIKENGGDLPVVSLDDLRRELDVDPADSQDRIIAAAQKQAREYLRSARPFIWNATNISKTVRGKCLRLLQQYNARIRLVYVEAAVGALQSQNKNRIHSVPEAVVDKLLSKWEVPDLTEAHEIIHVIH